MTQKAMINFEQIDSWFFRESRPHGSVGANALNSVFPPPIRTLLGAIRSHIGYQYFKKHTDKSWDDLQRLPELKAIIGDAHYLGSLQPRGVFLQEKYGRQVSYFLPAPSNICSKIEQEKPQYLAFQLTKNRYETDIGYTHLVELPTATKNISDTRGFKPLENTWFSKEVWEQVLSGDVSGLARSGDGIRSNSDFIAPEYRLGIALNSANRSVQEGLLYQTTHLRLKSGVSVCMPIEYDKTALTQAVGADLLQQATLLRLGGEARMASVTLNAQADYLPKAPQKLTTTIASKKRFMLYFISKLAMQDKSWLPAGFSSNEQGWQGKINDIEVQIISACMSKAYREGGWDQLGHQPRAIENYLPVGSALFVEVDASIDDTVLIASLHGQCVNKNAWGEGLMLVGRLITA